MKTRAKAHEPPPAPAALAPAAGGPGVSPPNRTTGAGDLFPYADFARAASALIEALEAGPCYGVVVGASGTGKSSLLRYVARSVDRHRFHTLYIVQAHVSPAALGRLLAQALHVGTRRTHAETLRTLAQVIRESPQELVLLVDEAQRLSSETIDELRLLAESELDRGPLFAVVLAGSPDLRERLEAPDLAGLRRRISLKLELTGLTSEECRPFLAKRLGAPAADRLDPEALSLLFERGRGIPALVERYAVVALRHAKNGDKIDKTALADAIDAWEEL
jgi:general secretion pathway protein A